MIDRSIHVPLYIQLKDEIMLKIKNNVWKVKEKIPTEKELMKCYNLGRATVRQALSILVNEGYLYKKQGIGTFVAQNKPIFAFEPFISLDYSLKIRGISSNNVIDTNKIIEPSIELLRKLKWSQKRPCIYIKRIRYGEKLPLAIERSYFDEEFIDILDNGDITNSIAKMLVETMNLNISKVEQIIIPRNSNKEERERLKIDKNTMVLELQRWIYVSEKKEPYYYLNFSIPTNLKDTFL